MMSKNKSLFAFTILMLIITACSFSPVPAATATPAATNTPAATSTKVPTPTRTPLPTKTPNLAATKQSEEWNAEIQQYFEKGYIGTADGAIKGLDDFSEAWAQMDWYTIWSLDETVTDFVYSAHFKWSNASKTPNPYGCGLVFAIQDDGSDYAVFLNQDSILYLRTKFHRGFNAGKTRGTGKTNIGDASEADIAVIVYNYYSYVLVNGEVVGEYTLPQSDSLEGDLGVSILSGTNKGYGTRCSITDMRLWTPNQ